MAIWATVGYLATLSDIRRALRRERRARELTLDRLSEQASVDRAAIHKIENVAKHPTYEPGLGTVLKLIGAMGITEAAFFSGVEATPSASTAPATTGTTVLTIPLVLDEAEQALAIQAAVDVARGRESARTELRRRRRQASSPKRRKQG